MRLSAATTNKSVNADFVRACCPLVLRSLRWTFVTGDFAVSTHLSYESKFTDRTLKWALFAVWAIGILVGMTFALWLINADHRKCILIPGIEGAVEAAGHVIVAR